MSATASPADLRQSAPRALVTGASVGIGACFAECLARDGYDLVIVARNRDRLDELADKIRRQRERQVDVLAADLTRADELRMVEQAVAGDTRLELLVNNAGFGTVGRFADLEVEREEEEIRLNVLALVHLTRAALPGMVARGHGAIINVSSLAAFQPGPFSATYGATKAYVNSFSEAIHEELRGTGVKVQVLCPGFTRTEFQERAGINATRIPSFAWMSAEAVVEASLAGLARGEVICIPGLGNRVLASLISATPRSVLRRAMATAGKRYKD